MSDFSFCLHSTSQENKKVPSEGSPQGVIQGRGEVCRGERPRRMSFEEARDKALKQVDYSSGLYRLPTIPPADNSGKWKAIFGRAMLEYESRMALAWSLCMTMAEVYTMGDGRLIRVDGENIEVETVKEIFEQLGSVHICKVVEAIRQDCDPERRKYNRRYFRAALYNAVFELEAQEQAGCDSQTY